MTATDELRRLLDERGIEYYPKAAYETVFSTGTEHVHVQDDLIDGCLELFIRPVTPAQAVEATLGRGTCKLVPTRDKPRSKAPTLTCSECGWWTDEIGKAWNYCPSCGRRVIG